VRNSNFQKKRKREQVKVIKKTPQYASQGSVSLVTQNGLMGGQKEGRKEGRMEGKMEGRDGGEEGGKKQI
jgi:hypothetical protein